MKRFIAVILVLITIVAVASVGYVEAGGRGGGHRGGWNGGGGHGGGHGHFHGGGRVFVGVGPFWPYGGWGPYWGPYAYPSYSPYAYYPYATPTVVVREPPVYVQQAPVSTGMWYYCRSAGAYYPSVPACPEAWVPVPPHSN
jgi:hypothetical protein